MTCSKFRIAILISTCTYDQVEVMTAEDSDDDMEDVEEGIPMQGEDGQHYVVLEVRSPDTLSRKSTSNCLI